MPSLNESFIEKIIKDHGFLPHQEVQIILGELYEGQCGIDSRGMTLFSNNHTIRLLLAYYPKGLY